MAVPLNSSKLITVYGGSGFVGRHVVRALAQTGCRLRIAVRRPDLAGHLQPMGGVGQIHAVQANLRDKASVRRAAIGADALVNLVGILFAQGRQTFSAVHTQGARNIAETAAELGVRSLVHLSSIGADAKSDCVAELSAVATRGGAASPAFRRTRSVDQVGRKSETTRCIACLQFEIRALARTGADEFNKPAMPADAGHR